MCILIFQLNGKAHCCAISPDGSAYAVSIIVFVMIIIIIMIKMMIIMMIIVISGWYNGRRTSPWNS